MIGIVMNMKIGEHFGRKACLYEEYMAKKFRFLYIAISNDYNDNDCTYFPPVVITRLCLLYVMSPSGLYLAEISVILL